MASSFGNTSHHTSAALWLESDKRVASANVLQMKWSEGGGMRALGSFILLMALMGAGAWGVYHLWKWLELLSNGQANLESAISMAVALCVLGGATAGVIRVVNWLGMEDGAGERPHHQGNGRDA